MIEHLHTCIQAYSRTYSIMHACVYIHAYLQVDAADADGGIAGGWFWWCD